MATVKVAIFCFDYALQNRIYLIIYVISYTKEKSMEEFNVVFYENTNGDILRAKSGSNISRILAIQS